MDQRPVPESARMFSSHTQLAYSGGEGASSVSTQQGRHVRVAPPSSAASAASAASGWSGGGYAVASSPAAARASSVDAVAHGGMRSSRLGRPQQQAAGGAADAPGWDGEQGDRDECLEEWAVQRFQRLFPERISARLVTHGMGRRATEAALCNTIIDTYHRLLREAANAAPALYHQAAPALPNHLLEQDVPMWLEGSADAGDAQAILHFMEVEEGANTSASGGAAAGSMDTESEGMFLM
jgi:hypothetical protein